MILLVAVSACSFLILAAFSPIVWRIGAYQYIFPDGAQFPLADAIRAAERNKNLMLQRVMDNTTDYYRTIRCWIANLEMQKNICLAALPVPSEASERYNDFVFYLKWAEFLYKTGRSRCYTCVWTKKK